MENNIRHLIVLAVHSAFAGAILFPFHSLDISLTTGGQASVTVTIATSIFAARITEKRYKEKFVFNQQQIDDAPKCVLAALCMYAHADVLFIRVWFSFLQHSENGCSGRVSVKRVMLCNNMFDRLSFPTYDGISTPDFTCFPSTATIIIINAEATATNRKQKNTVWSWQCIVAG